MRVEKEELGRVGENESADEKEREEERERNWVYVS